MHEGLPTFLASAGTITLLSLVTIWLQKWRREAETRKVVQRVLSSPASAWKRVGRVKELIIYPLKSGHGKNVETCEFEKSGMRVDRPAAFSLKDRMFAIYDDKTRKIATARQYPKLILVDVTPIDETRAKLEAPDMPELIFEIPMKDTKAVECIMWYNERLACFDCGPAANEWFSKYLLDADSGISMGMFIPERSKRDLVHGAWNEHAQLYKNMRNDDAGIFSDLISYMIMSQASVDVLSEKLEATVPVLQLRPNVLVDGCEAYAEDDWEWIRIGAEAIIRRVKLCTRCSLTRVDPITGIADPKSEVLKALKNYRKLKDPELNKLENYAPAIGSYCGLYRVGVVKLGDDVYVYQP